jgi:alkylhydroperoxidase family enzyme
MSTEDRKRAAHRALVARILQGEGRAPRDQRRAAFDNSGLGEPLRTLIGKVAERPAQITDDDVAAVKRSGLTEDEIFELVVCAAVGQATRQYEAALGALALTPSGQGTTEHASRDPQ